jgi:hypothetical protein
MRRFTRVWLPIAGTVAALAAAFLVGTSTAASASDDWDYLPCQNHCPPVSPSPSPSS